MTNYLKKITDKINEPNKKNHCTETRRGNISKKGTICQPQLTVCSLK